MADFGLYCTASNYETTNCRLTVRIRRKTTNSCKFNQDKKDIMNAKDPFSRFQGDFDVSNMQSAFDGRVAGWRSDDRCVRELHLPEGWCGLLHAIHPCGFVLLDADSSQTQRQLFLPMSTLPVCPLWLVLRCLTIAQWVLSPHGHRYHQDSTSQAAAPPPDHSTRSLDC